MSPGIEPEAVHHGLAVYRRGEGPPLLLLPYPHASGGGPMIDSALAALVAGRGRQVCTFDPPGQYRSTRQADVSLAEMRACAAETLDVLGVPSPVAVLGHSMGALCAFDLALSRPELVTRLVLVGTPPGSGTALIRYRAMPFHWPPWHPDLWRMLGWGLALAAGRGNLAMHKRLDHLLAMANLVDQRLVPPLVIEPGDRDRPGPPADRWWLAIRGTRLVPVAARLLAPTLLMVGRHDPQTPLRVSVALHARMPDSRLEVFERSGHAPFLEEPQRFAQVLSAFLTP